MSMTSWKVRQGDVLLEKIDSLPKGAIKQKDAERIVLAFGEQTGHAHAISTEYATRYEWQGNTLVEVKKESKLVHEEHAAIALAPGVYKKTQQKEYSPAAILNVAD
jgi:hypothetical protein